MADRVRGMRFGLARRLLGAFEGADIDAPTLAKRLQTRDRAAKELAAMCQRTGIPITVGWLERGEIELPAIAIPPSALVPKPEPRPAARFKGQRRAKKPVAKEG